MEIKKVGRVLCAAYFFNLLKFYGFNTKCPSASLMIEF